MRLTNKYITARGDLPNLVSNLLLLCYCILIQGVLEAKHLPSARQIHMGCPSSRHRDKEAGISLDALENTRQSCSDALKTRLQRTGTSHARMLQCRGSSYARLILLSYTNHKLTRPRHLRNASQLARLSREEGPYNKPNTVFTPYWV